MGEFIEQLVDNEWFVAFIGGIFVTIAAAYIVAFSGLGPSLVAAPLPRRSSPQPLTESLSVSQLAPSTRTTLTIWVQYATPNVGVNIDIYDPSGRQREGSFIRAEGDADATGSFAWPIGGGRPEAGLWHIITHNSANGSEASAYLWVT